jgi:hypothetical protein
MRNIRRSTGVSGLLVLTSIVLIAGCNSPTAVEPGYQAPALSTQETPYPTMDQICNSIANEIESLCPRVYPYRNWGEENSCVKTLMAQLLGSYKDCLSGDQLSEVRDCVFAHLAIDKHRRPQRSRSTRTLEARNPKTKGADCRPFFVVFCIRQPLSVSLLGAGWFNNANA